MFEPCCSPISSARSTIWALLLRAHLRTKAVRVATGLGPSCARDLDRSVRILAAPPQLGQHSTMTDRPAMPLFIPRGWGALFTGGSVAGALALRPCRSTLEPGRSARIAIAIAAAIAVAYPSQSSGQ